MSTEQPDDHSAGTCDPASGELITDPTRAQWLARLRVLGSEATYTVVADLAEEVAAGRLSVATAGDRLRAAVDAARGLDGMADLNRIHFGAVNWAEIVAEEADGRMYDR